MPPRIRVRFPSYQLRVRSISAQQWPQLFLMAQRRSFADDTPIAQRPLEDRGRFENEPQGPNMNQLPHVSEEKAATSQVMGEEGPDVDQGTPVEEVVKGDKEAQENLPKVMKDEMKKKKASTGSAQGGEGKKSYSTYARNHSSNATSARQFSTYSRLAQMESQTLQPSEQQGIPPPLVPHAQEEFDFEYLAEEVPKLNEATIAAQEMGHKFELPTLPLPKGSHLRKRYEPIVEQVTKLLMKDGKLSVAQRNMGIILTHLRTAPAPRPSEKYSLVSNAPTHSALPLNPAVYLEVAIDSVAPLFRIRSEKGAAGGGVALQIPVPLRQRQRRRTAVMWILDQVEKKRGGTSPFPKRFAEEVVAVVEGRSAVWERRTALHSLGVRARANLNFTRPGKKR